MLVIYSPFRNIEEEAKRSALLPLATEGLALLGTDGRIQYLNRAAEHLLQITSAEAAGKCFPELTSTALQADETPYPQAALSEIFDASLRAERHLVLGLTNSEKGPIWLSVRIEPLVYAPDKKNGRIGIRA